MSKKNHMVEFTTYQTEYLVHLLEAHLDVQQSASDRRISEALLKRLYASYKKPKQVLPRTQLNKGD